MQFISTWGLRLKSEVDSGKGAREGRGRYTLEKSRLVGARMPPRRLNSGRIFGGYKTTIAFRRGGIGHGEFRHAT